MYELCFLHVRKAGQYSLQYKKGFKSYKRQFIEQVINIIILFWLYCRFVIIQVFLSD
jgi:hypothetical protein